MTINLNGVEFYSAQEVEERIREAIAGQDKKVDMEKLPIGTLVKVVGNRAGHEHEVGEILPITEVDEGILAELYRLDGRSVGWVAVDDIEFVSFPEEEESTSGNEENPDLGFKKGDYAKVLKRNMIFDYGDELKILDVEGDGHPLAEREDGVDGYAIASQLMKIDKPSGDEGMTVDEDDSEIKAGDIVIATEDEFDITEGVEYEIREDVDGDLYFLDDDRDARHVSVHEDRLRKKSDKRVFNKGDIVYIKGEITDNFGDSIRPGVLTEFIEAGIGRGVRNPDGRAVLVEDEDMVKLTLVCRAEDRQDK